MKILTKAIKNAIPPVSPDRLTNPLIVTKFFNPTGAHTWYVAEAQAYLTDGHPVILATLDFAADQQWRLCGPDAAKIDDILYYGYVTGVPFPEWGPFSHRELGAVKGRFGLHMERDLYWSPRPFSTIDRR